MKDTIFWYLKMFFATIFVPVVLMVMVRILFEVSKLILPELSCVIQP